jgi:hypothetical protein
MVHCIIGNNPVKAKISHIGRGKFRIIEDDKDGKYSNVEIDASDVFHCRE